VRLYLVLSCSVSVFQAEDGIRDRNVTGVQTCALPIFSGDLLYFSQKTVETVFYYVLRNLIFHHGGGGSAPLGVDESKRAVIAHLSDHIQRLLEVFLGLPRESYDDIRGK